jgi:hypothetical protein
MQTGDIAARKRPMLSFVQPISVHEYLSYLPDQWFLHRVSERTRVHLRLQPAKGLQTSDHGPRWSLRPSEPLTTRQGAHPRVIDLPKSNLNR